jgi:hypothetical protein
MRESHRTRGIGQPARPAARGLALRGGRRRISAGWCGTGNRRSRREGMSVEEPALTPVPSAISHQPGRSVRGTLPEPSPTARLRDGGAPPTSVGRRPRSLSQSAKCSDIPPVPHQRRRPVLRDGRSRWPAPLLLSERRLWWPTASVDAATAAMTGATIVVTVATTAADGNYRR